MSQPVPCVTTHRCRPGKQAARPPPAHRRAPSGTAGAVCCTPAKPRNANAGRGGDGCQGERSPARRDLRQSRAMPAAGCPFPCPLRGWGTGPRPRSLQLAGLTRRKLPTRSTPYVKTTANQQHLLPRAIIICMLGERPAETPRDGLVSPRLAGHPWLDELCQPPAPARPSPPRHRPALRSAAQLKPRLTNGVIGSEGRLSSPARDAGSARRHAAARNPEVHPSLRTLSPDLRALGRAPASRERARSVQRARREGRGVSGRFFKAPPGSAARCEALRVLRSRPPHAFCFRSLAAAGDREESKAGSLNPGGERISEPWAAESGRTSGR